MRLSDNCKTNPRTPINANFRNKIVWDTVSNASRNTSIHLWFDSIADATLDKSWLEPSSVFQLSPKCLHNNLFTSISFKADTFTCNGDEYADCLYRNIDDSIAEKCVGDDCYD
ncbi:unnamed protein product [Leptidea sinapis]|uniref:Uncharacterized protein n=1 Tax=Leptidea sinapis TaxID=189913 RepID=A0A5E4QLM4_9NEOP|nr:unnamed protein product [Leptidea sinapis]